MPLAQSNLGALIRRPEAGSLLGLLAVYTFFAYMGGEVFMGAPGWSSILNTAAEVGIIALPIGLLMIAGELDISVGAVVPAAGLVMAILCGHYELPTWIGVLAGLVVGILVGFVNGILVTRTAIPSLIVTIGTMFGVMGLTLGFTVLIAGSTGVFMTPDPFMKGLLGQMIHDIFKVTILWWLGFIAVFVYLLQYSPWGNWIFAIGGDRVSARNAGIPTDRVTIGLYVLSGLAAAFVGVSQVLNFQSAQVAAGQSFIFNSIMCVVIGGVLLTGGAGSVIGVVLGTLTFATVNQGMFFSGLDPNFGSIIIGALLLIAVMTNDGFRRLAMNFSVKKK